MNREEMLEMLHAIDAELKRPLKIVITGASALILRGSISRSSKDIDILSSKPRFEQIKFKEIVEKITAKNHLENDWIDTSPSVMTFEHLPGYKPDLQRINGNFNHLEPYIISKVDSVITKFAYYENIRQWDKKDIKELQFSDVDYKILREKLKKLSLSDSERALRIEIEFKSLKPDFIKTEEGFRYSNSHEIAKYAQERYGFELEENYLKQLDEDALNVGSRTYVNAVLETDYKALQQIIKRKSKGHDHGMDQ